jgi:hypothetical protein
LAGVRGGRSVDNVRRSVDTLRTYVLFCLRTIYFRLV